MDDLNLDNLRVDPAKLEQAREATGLKGSVVARKLGIQRQRLWSYEKGVSPIPSDLLLRIAALYQKPVEFFQTIEV